MIDIFDNIDNTLMNELVDYNIYRKTCFKNGIIPIFEDKKMESLLSSRYQKCSRIKKHLIYLVLRYEYLYFVTFTFDDEHLNLCDRSRKDLIKKSLYSFDSNIKFILNIDYGKNTERLHYHCIVATNDCGDFFHHLKLYYPCFTWIERLYISNDGLKRLPKYINKLSNHAIKDSTRKSRVIYNFKGYDKFGKDYGKVLFFYDSQRVGL